MKKSQYNRGVAKWKNRYKTQKNGEITVTYRENLAFIYVINRCFLAKIFDVFWKLLKNRHRKMVFLRKSGCLLGFVGFSGVGKSIINGRL